MTVQHDAQDDTGTSTFGEWADVDGLPVFHEQLHPDDPACEWDPIVAPPTSRHWCGIGNRRFQVYADNHGTCAVWDTAHEFRWITAAEPGTGATVIHAEGADAEGSTWATDRDRWPESWTADRSPAVAPTRTWGPTWFTVSGRHDGITIERMVACPEGDSPWVLIRVGLTSDRSREVEITEEWSLAGRTVTGRWGGDRSPAALRTDGDSADPAFDDLGATVWQPTSTVAQQAVRLHSYSTVDSCAIGTTPDGDHVIGLRRRIALDPSTPTELWFALGLPDESAVPDDPAATWSESRTALAQRLPTATSYHVPVLSREMPWHVALLTGGACTDTVLGGHTLDQASAYSFHFGFNGAARDPLQHALPLVYCEPDLALSVLRNTCAWAAPTGELPYALGGMKEPLTERFRPSDQALWSLWLAAEYAAATGDEHAFGELLAYHPVHATGAVPLLEHLVRQFRHLVDVIGVGDHGHIRIQNADWNDSALTLAPVERSAMEAHGESILNSAMAAWVLPRFAGLLRRLASAGIGTSVEVPLEDIAEEAEQRADEWRTLVAGEWTGRWYRRAYGPGATIGEDDLWLEVQPWAILCGAADDERASELLATIQTVLRDGSPLGARLRGPRPIRIPAERFAGEGTAGGIWFSINMTLAWAAARLDPDLAWDELRCMTLAAHSAAYPSIWEGTLSGPDAYNTPESARPGHTWAWGTVGMQSFPVNNLHSHAQVVFTYLRLLGVEPAVDGSLLVDGRGGTFASQTLELDGEGHGSLRSSGPVVVRTPTVERRTEGGGLVTW